MSSQQRQVTVRHLVEEAKRRIVFWVICVVGLSYLMSLTSSSVWINLPAAASLIILLRYFSLDYEMRRKAAMYNNKTSSEKKLPLNKPIIFTRVVEKSEWRKKVNSPIVEEAIDQFTRHLVSEWVTDLWYTRLTPDREGPEELVQTMNDVLGEFSSRMKNINLIDLLTRDLINLVCAHLELFRASQAKIEKQQSGLWMIEQRDKELRRVLASENKLHPALFSSEAEHKVLQHLMDGLVSHTFMSEDLQCTFFRYIVRELLASAVMRPVLNLASPRFINERIENFVISKANKAIAASQEASQLKSSGSSRISSDHFSKFLDPAATGVELVQLKNNQSKNAAVTPGADNTEGSNASKDPLLSINTQSSRPWNLLTLNSQISDGGGLQRHQPGGEWGEMLDMISRRKTAALAPENFENMWTKGRNYRKKDGKNRVVEQVPEISSVSKSVIVDHSNKMSKPKGKDGVVKLDPPLAPNVDSMGIDRSTVENFSHHTDQNKSNHAMFTSYHNDIGKSLLHVDEVETGGSSSFSSEDEDPNSVMGLDSPGTKVWDGKTNRNTTVSHIHHPLENPEGRIRKKTNKGNAHYQRALRPQSNKKRSRLSTHNIHIWQEIERTSFLSGDGLDILGKKGYARADNFADDSDENLDRFYRESTAGSLALSISSPQSGISLKKSLMVDSFFKLKCEVLGANIVKSASKTFAVYSISVSDTNNNSWSIKRRFQHFEELHRRLKEYSEYNLHLPPKYFLSTGLDMSVILERCKLLDSYLKVLQLSTVSGSIEVWDFLSVDSQTYVFINSFSIIETLPVDLDDKPSEKSKKVEPLYTKNERVGGEYKESALQTKHSFVPDLAGTSANDMSYSPGKKLVKEFIKSFEDSGSDSDAQAKNARKVIRGRENDSSPQTSESFHDAATDPTVPTEWVPPNLTLPILDLVDVIFQLQDGGWIRRKAFWVAKQILQLGMGDALDDWLLEKIQLLRKGSVIASGIKRVEQILWPDGIFITKHPKRLPSSAVNSPRTQQPAEMTSPKSNSPLGRQSSEISTPRLSDEQQQEADRRAKLVYELMIDNAPAAVVSLVGRKEYEQCVKDLYFFLQSSVFLKQMAFDLLELLLLSTFPEMDYVFRQLHEEKHKFDEFNPN